MAERQGATRPPWLGRSRWELLGDVIGGWRQNIDKVVQLVALLFAIVRPALVKRRLNRLRDLGHIDAIPRLSQLLVAGRDQIVLTASEETRAFYESQGIPWVFHNLRRFIAGPATMMDPIGLFSPRETIIHHVLQTFHRHPLYDLVLLRAHDGGIEEMARQAAETAAGTHLHQRALASLIEDGAYHQRLPQDIAVFVVNPHAEARPVPEGLMDDPHLMLAMDQFKDIRGFTRYASHLHVGPLDALVAWLTVAFDETLGRLLGLRIGPRRVRVDACDAEMVARHVGLIPGIGPRTQHSGV